MHGGIAQGAIKFTNLGSGPNGTAVNAKFYSVSLYGQTKLSGNGYSVQLYAATIGTPESSLTAVSPVVTFNTGVFAGYMASAPTVTINGVAIGSQAIVQFRAWDNQGGIVTSWQSAPRRGQSAVIQTPNLGDPLNPGSIPVAVGLTCVDIVTPEDTPEPSTIALGVLGMAGLVLIHRRK